MVKILDPNLVREPHSISSFMAGYKSIVLHKIDDLIDNKGYQYGVENSIGKIPYGRQIIMITSSKMKRNILG